MKKLHVLQHIDREGPGLFKKIAEEKGFAVEIYRLDLGDNLPNLNKCDFVLIMGGPMGLKDISNEKYYWLKNEVNFIKKAIDRNIKIIGVCLGAQLLAYASGGNVIKLKGSSPLRPFPEIGWLPIFSRLNNQDNKLANLLEKPMYVLHWHSDRILLPKNAVIIASSKRCKEQLFKIGKSCYGLQFHIETQENMTSRWINEDKAFILSALGSNGQKKLTDQDNIYSNSTLNKRILFLEKLIDLVISE